MNNTVQLKKLQSLLNKFNSEAETIKIQISAMQKEYNQKTKEVNNLKKEIAKYQAKGEPIVSEHALLRYLERVEKLDLEEYKNLILDEEILRQIEILGTSGTFLNSKGFKVVMKNNVVITVED